MVAAPFMSALASSVRIRPLLWSIVIAGLLGQGCGATRTPREAHAPPGRAVAVAAPAFAPSPVPVEADDAQWGESTAPVTIVAFLDLECPFCARAEPILAEVEERHGPSRLRVVWKHSPLPFHPHAAEAARASRAALELGGSRAFFAFTSDLLSDPGGLGADAYARAAKKAGIDPGKLAARAATPEVAARVQQDVDLAGTIGVGGTPHFFVNGTRIEGLVPAAVLDAIVARELAAADALRARGVKPLDVYGQRSTENYARAEEEARAASEPDDKTVWAVPLGTSPRLGPDDALVTVVEFSDYQCPFCKRVEPSLAELRKRYPDTLRIVWKHAPLPFHEHALPAARLAVEARAELGDPGFFRATALIFEASPELEDERLLAIGKTLGLDSKKLRKALDDHTRDGEILDDQAVGARFGVTGTPHFFINGRRLVGAQPVEEFVRLVEEELVEARRLVERGTPRSRIYEERTRNAAGSLEAAPPAR